LLRFNLSDYTFTVRYLFICLVDLRRIEIDVIPNDLYLADNSLRLSFDLHDILLSKLNVLLSTIELVDKWVQSGFMPLFLFAKALGHFSNSLLLFLKLLFNLSFKSGKIC
jgi:hypothetical protein